MTLHVRQARKNLNGGAFAANARVVSDLVGHPNVRLAPAVALLLRANNTAALRSAEELLAGGAAGGLLLLAAPQDDVLGAPYTDNAPAAPVLGPAGAAAALVRAARRGSARVVLDAAFDSFDDEMVDAAALLGAE